MILIFKSHNIWKYLKVESKAVKRTYQTPILHTFSRVSVSPWSSVSSFDWCLFIECGHVVFMFMFILKWRHKLVFSYCHFLRPDVWRVWKNSFIYILLHLSLRALNLGWLKFVLHYFSLQLLILPFLMSFVMHAWKLNFMYNLLSTKY